MADYTAQIQSIYLAYYGRPADVPGLAYWNDALDEAGGDLTAIINAFGTSTEATALYSADTNLAKVNAIYLALFNRAGDTEGLLFYVALLNSGAKSQASIALDILNGAKGDDLTLIEKKLLVSDDFTAAMQTDSTAMLAYDGDTAATTARAMLSAVTADSDDSGVVETTLTTIETDATDTTTAAAQTFTLTTSDAGDATGDTGDDKFIALNDALTQYVVDGADGEDTLIATISADDTYDVSNVEAITFKVTAAATIDMDDFSGEKSVTVKSSGNATLENFDASVALVSEQTGTADLTVTLDDASGSADSLDLTLDDATTTGEYTFANIETIALTSSGSENVIDLVADSATALDISGSADIDVTLLAATASLATIDASAATGDVTIDASAVALTLDVTGGSGDDTLEIGLFLDAEDVINMGAGEDTLSVDASATIIDAETDITNVETLSITSVAATDALDASIASFDNIVYTSTADADEFAITGVTTESITITTTDDATDLAEVNISLDDATGESDTATLIIENSAEDGADFEVTLIASAAGGIETLALDLVQGSDVEGSDITVAGITTGDFTTLEISGDADATIGSTAIETIDASEATGNLTITLGAADQDVTGGSGDDTFTFDAEELTTDDTIDGGSGEDTLATGLLGAGTAAATVTGVETISVGFLEANGSTFSGVNLSDDVVSIELDAETDGDVVITKLGDSVASIRLGSTNTAVGDTATITYVSTADSAHTVTIGNTDGEDVAMGAVTINNNAGALTVESDGETANVINGFAADDAASLEITASNALTVTTTTSATSAATVSVVTDGGALTFTGAQDFSAATELTFSAADGNITFTGAMTATDATSLVVTAEADDFVQTGTFTSAADIAVSLTADGEGTVSYTTLDADALATLDLVATDGGDVTVSNIVMTGENAEGDAIDVEITLDATGTDSTVTVSDFDSVAATTLALVTIISDAEGTVDFTSGDTNLTITEIDASESLGSLTIDTSDLAAATTITFGDGTNDITTDLGFADDITLAAEGGTDTINIMDDQTAADTITNFVAGADGDVISIDVSAIGAGAQNFASTALDDSLSVKLATDDDGTLVDADNTALATSNILVLTDTFANIAAVFAAINLDDEANVGGLLDNDVILVVWTDGADSYLSSVTLNGADGAAADAGSDLVQLVGVDVTALTAANFAFV